MTSKDSLQWLYGGNYSADSVMDFNTILTKFASQCYMEQDHLLEIMKWMFDENDFCAMDEDEVLPALEKFIKSEE